MDREGKRGGWEGGKGWTERDMEGVEE